MDATTRTLQKMRPDILVIEGLHADNAPTRDPNATITQSKLTEIQQNCSIIVAELGYTHEHSHDLCLTRKHEQHVSLIQALREAGWKIQQSGTNDVHILLLGTCATIFDSADKILRNIGIAPAQIPDILRSLHIHAVHYAVSILRLRRELERNPLELYLASCTYIPHHIKTK